MEAFLKRRGLVLAGVAGLSVAAHLWGISSPPLDYHYHRQVNTAAIARNFHENGLKIWCPQIDWEGNYSGCSATEFPLYMWLVGLFWPVAGLGELWGRILAVGFSAATAVYLLLFLERWVEKEAAFYGAALFSCIPLEMFFGRSIQPEALALLGSVAGLYHWDASLRGGGSVGHAVAGAVWVFLSISHKLPYIHVLIPFAALTLHHRGRRGLRHGRTWAAVIAVLGATYGWYKYASYGKYVVPTNPNEFFSLLQYERLPYYVFFQFTSRFPELAATYGGLLLIWFGVRELIWGRGAWFFAAWWLAVAAHLAAGGYYTHQHEYTSLPFAPVNAAFMGLGLLKLKEKAERNGKPMAWAGLALLVLSVPVHAGLRIRKWYRVGYPYLAHARKAADAVSGPGDLFLCNERGSSVFLFYARRRGWSWDVSEAGEKRIGEVEDKIRAGAKFYLTNKTEYFKDRGSFFARWFYSRFPVVYDQDDLLIFKLR